MAEIYRAFMSEIAKARADELAEVEALRRDAERYRWLRQSVSDWDCVVSLRPWPDYSRKSGDELDAAVDAARWAAGGARAPTSRYVLHPGYVVNAADGLVYFVGGPRLAELHGLDIRASNVVFGDMPGFQARPGDVHLFPTATAISGLTALASVSGDAYQPPEASGTIRP